jgi:hypothetical protein
LLDAHPEAPLTAASTIAIKLCRRPPRILRWLNFND